MKKIVVMLFFFCSTTVLFDAVAKCEPASISQAYYDQNNRLIGYGDSSCTVLTGTVPQGEVCCEGPGC
jgi:hypothetical protein